MPSSHRDRLADLYAYSNVGTDGYIRSTYTRTLSAEADDAGMWLCRGEPVGATESPIAGQQQHVIDYVFLFGEDAEAALSTDGVIYYETRFYKINGISPVRLPGETEFEVTATYISDEVYDSLVGGP